MIDDLTGLYNRRYFNAVIRKELSRSQRHIQAFSLLFFDIDDFKTINDRYGHDVGDEVLRNIGVCLNRTLRSEDVACRYGGEEFAVILPETYNKGSLAIGNRIKDEIAGIKIGEVKDITISGGFSTFPDDTDKVDVLIRNADKAMYRAEFSGKNKILEFSMILFH